ncbi:MAG: DUF2452 domain-containing protein [Flavobacteriales bacterium]|nr:DUF2452 domain-containing protein [Flavobacteriales bacterium]
MNEEKEEFENPIDKDTVTENPSSLAYPHHRGSLPVAPNKQGEIKIKAMSAMQHQTDQQLMLIKRQMELLAKQASEIQDRVEISERIYGAEIRFKPDILHTYHLYEKDSGKHTLSLIGPTQWGRMDCPFTFVASVKLLGDHTWEIVE